MTRRATEFVDLITSGHAPSEPFLLAEGRPGIEGKGKKFVWSNQFQREAEAWQGDVPINYYKMSSIVTVESGEAIGTLQSAVRGPAQRSHRRNREARPGA